MCYRCSTGSLRINTSARPMQFLQQIVVAMFARSVACCANAVLMESHDPSVCCSLSAWNVLEMDYAQLICEGRSSRSFFKEKFID